MSRIETTITAQPGAAAYAERTQAALRSIEASRRSQESANYALIAGAMSYGEAAQGDGMFAKISHGAKLLCIAFAMLAPNLLLIRVVL